ncbi:hypothetical protein VCHC19A1_0233, partial [Vibrio cholerae HC-19A1]
MRLLLVN